MSVFWQKGEVGLNRWRIEFGLKSQPADPKLTPDLSVDKRDLARIGIAARKIPRVLAELARAARTDPSLADRVTALRLARAIAALLP